MWLVVDRFVGLLWPVAGMMFVAERGVRSFV
jgi:hypothetical protein